MKTIIYIFLPLLFMGITACSTGSGAMSKKSNKEEPRTINNPDETLDLVDHLRRFSGVQIYGSGRSASITIRGVSSINNSSEPLFVVNGNIISGGLAQAYDLVRVENIKSLRILKSPTEIGIYGVRGTNGIVEILLKN